MTAWARATLLGTMLLLSACSQSLMLTVDLRTDLVAGVDFTAVHTTLATTYAAGMRPTGRVADHSVFFGDPVAAGVRVAELDGIAAGSAYVVVELLDARGAVVASRPVAVTISASYALTVVITRDCRGVVCPAAGDSAAAVACLGGRCVDPTCGAGGACPPPACTAATDCTHGAACSVPACVAGACFYAAGACGSGLYCDPGAGCLPDPVVMDAASIDADMSTPDGGPSDGGPDDAPMTDAPMTDAGPTDAGPTDAGADASAPPLTCGVPVMLGPATHVAAAGDGTVVLVVWSSDTATRAERVDGTGLATAPVSPGGGFACNVLALARTLTGYEIACVTTDTVAIGRVGATGADRGAPLRNTVSQVTGFTFLEDPAVPSDTLGVAWTKPGAGSAYELHHGVVDATGTIGSTALVTSSLAIAGDSLVGAASGTRWIAGMSNDATASASATWLTAVGTTVAGTASTGSAGHTTGGHRVGVATTSLAPSSLRFTLVEADEIVVNVVGVDDSATTTGTGGPFPSAAAGVAAAVGVPTPPRGSYRFLWSGSDGVHHGVGTPGVSPPLLVTDDGSYRALRVTDVAIGAIGTSQYVAVWVDTGTAWVVLGCD